MTDRKEDLDERIAEAIERPRTGPPPHDPDAYENRSNAADRGASEGDTSVSGDRGNRTGDRDSPGEPKHHGDGPHHGDR